MCPLGIWLCGCCVFCAPIVSCWAGGSRMLCWKAPSLAKAQRFITPDQHGRVTSTHTHTDTHTLVQHSASTSSKKKMPHPLKQLRKDWVYWHSLCVQTLTWELHRRVVLLLGHTERPAESDLRPELKSTQWGTWGEQKKTKKKHLPYTERLGLVDLISEAAVKRVWLVDFSLTALQPSFFSSVGLKWLFWTWIKSLMLFSEDHILTQIKTQTSFHPLYLM